MSTPRSATSRGACRYRLALESDPVVRRQSSAVRSTTVKSFYPMGRGEVATLVFLIAFSVFSFLPVWRSLEVAGMAVFGWLMAALMVISPALALSVFLIKRRRR